MGAGPLEWFEVHIRQIRHDSDDDLGMIDGHPGIPRVPARYHAIQWVGTPPQEHERHPIMVGDSHRRIAGLMHELVGVMGVGGRITKIIEHPCGHRVVVENQFRGPFRHWCWCGRILGENKLFKPGQLLNGFGAHPRQWVLPPPSSIRVLACGDEKLFPGKHQFGVSGCTEIRLLRDKPNLIMGQIKRLCFPRINSPAF